MRRYRGAAGMNSQNRTRQRFLAALGEPQVIVSLLVLYCAVHFLVRVLLSPNLALGESAQMLFGQSFQWDYAAHHPPLIDWLSWAALSVTNNSRLVLFLLRYVLLALALMAYFGAARAIIGDIRRAAFATFALLGAYGVGWLAHTGSANTVLLMALLSAYLWADAQALARPGYRTYLVLGGITGIGILSDYGFLVLPVAISIAVLLTPVLRARLRIVPLIPAAALAALIVAPYLYWVFASKTVSLVHSASPGAARNATEFFIALLLFGIPAFPAILLLRRRVAVHSDSQSGEDAGWSRFLAITILTSAALGLAALLVFDGSDGKSRWVYPAMLPVPIYLFLQMKPAAREDPSSRTALFGWSMLVCALAVIAGRVWIYETHAASCERCREYWPMARYADTFRQAGFVRGTVIAPTADLAANLRASFPDSRAVTPAAPALAFGPPVHGECLIVWPGEGELPRRTHDYVESTYGAKLQNRAVQGDSEARLLTSAARRARMNFVILPEGSCDRPRP